MTSGPAIGTLVVFILSTICVIFPFSFPIPFLGHRRVHINLTTAPIIAILVLLAAQCLIPKNIRDGIVGTDGVQPYNILILFFSLAYMAITLDITGVLQAAAFWVSNKGGSNGWKLYTYFYIMLTVLSIVLGNDPIILSGTPFLVYYTQVNELDHIAWLMSEFAAANTASMVLFVGNPTNVVICEGFRINNAAFTAYTILPFLACSITCFIALVAQFRSSKYIPKRLDVSGDLDVRAVLLDPIGAWVGSFILGSCLVVAIVVSFFRVDVWKITLPFALAKFVFDITWDYYRYTKKKSTSGQLATKDSDDELGLTMGEDELVLKQLKAHRITPAAIEDSETETRAPEETQTAENISFSSAPLQTRRNTRSSTKQTDTAIEDSETETRAPEETQTAENISFSSAPLQTRRNTRSSTKQTDTTLVRDYPLKLQDDPSSPPSHFVIAKRKAKKFAKRFPTINTALPRLPFALVPFAFSQFILIEALAHQGWIEIFGRWLVIATDRQIYPTIWLVGVLGVILCNCSGTNIGATILLTKIVRHAILSTPAGAEGINLNAFNRSAAIALAVASNIGAVSFTFSASLAGLLWKQILKQKGITISQRTFAKWNLLPLTIMTVVGLGVVSAEMAVLF